MASGTRKWIYTKEQLDAPPSTRTQGRPIRSLPLCTLEDERRLRSEAIGQMQVLAQQKLKTPTSVVSIAATILHRFYMHQSFLEFRRLHVASACLFLAMKSSKDHSVSLLAQKVTMTALVQFSLCVANIPEPPSSDSIKQHEEEILYCERALLATLGFEVPEISVHDLIAKYISILAIPDKSIRGTLFEKAYAVANSAMASTLWIKYPMEVVAVACLMYAELKLGAKYKIPEARDKRKWFDVVTVTLPNYPALEKESQEFIEEYRQFTKAEDRYLKESTQTVKKEAVGSKGRLIPHSGSLLSSKRKR
eukprot:m.67970 g.67970  ORF g.67970 m.67970 type:complete len:307 (-) comp23893_c0_seq1:580-1500(-)